MKSSVHTLALSDTPCSCRDVTVKACDLSDLLYIRPLSHRYCQSAPLSTSSKSLTHMERRACDLVHDNKKKFFQKACLSKGFVLKDLFCQLAKGKWSFRTTAWLVVDWLDWCCQQKVDCISSTQYWNSTHYSNILTRKLLQPFSSQCDLTVPHFTYWN